jgi:hypothetical protein
LTQNLGQALHSAAAEDQVGISIEGGECFAAFIVVFTATLIALIQLG